MPKKKPEYSDETYFTESPTIPSIPQDVKLKLSDISVSLQSDRGVFSYSEIDEGTLVLLEFAPEPPQEGVLLDLGCGYGPIAITLAHRHPNRTVWAVDVNQRAIELTKYNVHKLALPNVKVSTPEEVPEDMVFGAIYSNPPIRIGKEELQNLLLFWLKHLDLEGRAYWVVKKNLGADALVEWLSQQGFPSSRIRSKRGYRIIETRRDK